MFASLRSSSASRYGLHCRSGAACNSDFHSAQDSVTPVTHDHYCSICCCSAPCSTIQYYDEMPRNTLQCPSISCNTVNHICNCPSQVITKLICRDPTALPNPEELLWIRNYTANKEHYSNSTEEFCKADKSMCNVIR